MEVKYFGIGNEAWGCGGNMRPEYYCDLFRRYNTYLRNYDDKNRLFRIASGANAGDTNWTKVLMERIGDRMQGVSLHYYAVRDWRKHGSATRFTDGEYYNTLFTSLKMDELVKDHIAVMDKADPKNRVALMVDEWGTWWDEEPGTIRGHLYQQNCMRDAMVAALTLNIFHKYTERVKMANIAQVVNVLQSMILTDTKGTGIMNSLLEGYEPHRGDFPSRFTGSIVSDRAGNAVAYALFNLEPRGQLFVVPGDPVYEGMIVGEHNRDNDIDVNPTKEKKLTNMRASGKDEAVVLTPVRPMTLEHALHFVREDELVEVTPHSIRLRKAELNALKRYQSAGKKKIASPGK